MYSSSSMPASSPPSGGGANYAGGAGGTGAGSGGTGGGSMFGNTQQGYQQQQQPRFGGGGGGAAAPNANPGAGLDQGKIFVGGLSWQTTEESLMFHFQQYGAVTSVELMKDRNTGKPRGFGFVCFADPATVDLVMQEQHEVCHKVVDVKRAQARGVAPPSIHQERPPFQQQQQPQQPVGPMLAPPTAVPGAGDSAQSTQQQPTPTSFFGGGGAKPRSMFGQPKDNELTPEQLHCKVFVGGIPHSVDRDELRRIMSEYGTVVDSIIMVDQMTMRSRGFGFITFSDASGAEKSIAAQPINIQGKMVEIKLATPRPDRPPGDPSAVPAGGGARPFAAGGGGGAAAAAGGGYGQQYNKPGTFPNKFLGLRAGQVASNSEFAGFAVAYGRSGWKAGYGSRAFGRYGWNVQGWDEGDGDDNDDAKNGEDGDSKGKPTKPEPIGFSFSMLNEGKEEEESPPLKRQRNE